MTESEQQDAIHRAIDTLSRCRVRIVYNHMDELWLSNPYSVDIDNSITGLMGLLDSIEEPDS